jgi:molecular chaperone GrpE
MTKNDIPNDNSNDQLAEEPFEPTSQEETPQDDNETAALQEQLGQLTAALQRERADATNIRRRHDEQIAALSTSAKASVIKALLPVIDNFERSLKHVPQDLESNDYVKGIQGIVKQFEKVLADLGVERIKTVGEPFNPHLHEAVSMEEGDGEETVSEELQSGYILGDDVIRHAMVRVKG